MPSPCLHKPTTPNVREVRHAREKAAGARAGAASKAPRYPGLSAIMQSPNSEASEPSESATANTGLPSPCPPCERRTGVRQLPELHLPKDLGPEDLHATRRQGGCMSKSIIVRAVPRSEYMCKNTITRRELTRMIYTSIRKSASTLKPEATEEPSGKHSMQLRRAYFPDVQQEAPQENLEIDDTLSLQPPVDRERTVFFFFFEKSLFCLPFLSLLSLAPENVGVGVVEKTPSLSSCS